MITLERINCDPLLAEAGLAVCCTETFCTLMEQGAFRSANCRRVLAALYDAEPDAADPYRVRLPHRVCCFASLDRWARTALTVTAGSEARNPPVFALDTELMQPEIFWLLNSLPVAIHLAGDDKALRRLARFLLESPRPLPVPARHPAPADTPFRLLTAHGPVLTFQNREGTDAAGNRLVTDDGLALLRPADPLEDPQALGQMLYERSHLQGLLYPHPARSHPTWLQIETPVVNCLLRTPRGQVCPDTDLLIVDQHADGLVTAESESPCSARYYTDFVDRVLEDLPQGQRWALALPRQDAPPGTPCYGFAFRNGMLFLYEDTDALEMFTRCLSLLQDRNSPRP